MLLCLECYELFDEDYVNFEYDGDYNWCPKLDCGGNLIQVDELFVPVIIELNKKGYKTHYCCSGHIHEGHSGCIGSYIYFYSDISEDIENNIKRNMPQGYEFSYMSDGGIHINKRFNSNLSKNKLLKLICENAIEMTKWAENLPDLYK